MSKQRTLNKSINMEGIGLHTGAHVGLEFCPSQTDTGIQFLRTDIQGAPLIKASVHNILNPKQFPRRTSVGAGEVRIHTVEHLMAALSGFNIDNLLVKIDGEEVPGFDGSTNMFVEAFKKAGIKEQNVERNSFKVREPIWVQDDSGVSIVVLPYDGFRISYTLCYEHPFVGSDFLDIELSPESFEKDISSSRTFCLEEEVDGLCKMGLGKGANYKNTLVVSKQGIMENKLRFENEFIRHKILDLIGDLYMLGPLKAHVVATKSGHSLNIGLLREIQRKIDKAKSGGISAGQVPANKEVLDAAEIMKILPHRYPFLLVDRIIELKKGKRAVGIKNITINDEFFLGHFPDRPIMPGVLIIEAMAQVGGVLMLSPEENRGKLAYFMAADGVKFRKTVVPGDQLILKVEAVKVKEKTGLVKAEAMVDGKIVAEAKLKFALVKS